MQPSRIVIILSTAFALVGCGAGVSHQSTVAPLNTSELEALGYAAALEGVLSEYEAEVGEAVAEWYPSHADAWATTQALLTSDLTTRLDRHLALQGLDHVGLATYAESHPEFVREQNQLHRASTARLRPHIYAILGRVDADAAARPYDGPIEAAPNMRLDGSLAELGIR